jgi:hypothetical protein
MASLLAKLEADESFLEKFLTWKPRKRYNSCLKKGIGIHFGRNSRFKGCTS